MTEWLVRKFVKNHDDVENPRVRTAYGTFASIVCIACNIVLCAAKGAIGAAAGSVAIVADALNNLSDASSNIISLFGFKLASKPADAEHPYGHGRFEYLSGLAVAVLILIIGVELVRSSFEKILSPEPVEFSIAIVAVLALSILVKLWMALFNKRIGTRINSNTLMATAADSRNDVIATAAVLAATLASEFLGIDLDGWAGLAVGAFIIYSGAELVRDTVDPLLGKAPDPEFVQHIYRKITSYPGVLDTHDLIVHDYGPGRRFASAHVEMAAEMDPLKSHDIIDNIEEAFREEENILLVLHYDPHRHFGRGRRRSAQMDSGEYSTHRPAPDHPRSAHRSRPHAHQCYLRRTQTTRPRSRQRRARAPRIRNRARARAARRLQDNR